MASIGLGVFVILMALSFVINILFVGIAIIAIYVVMAVIATEKIKAFGAKTNYTIRRRETLREVGEIIDSNMKLAFVLMTVLFPLIAVAVLKSAYACTALIAVASFSLTPYTMSAEKKFKAMKVDSFDIEIASDFAAMLVRWKEPKFGLKK